MEDPQILKPKRNLWTINNLDNKRAEYSFFMHSQDTETALMTSFPSFSQIYSRRNLQNVQPAPVQAHVFSWLRRPL